MKKIKQEPYMKITAGLWIDVLHVAELTQRIANQVHELQFILTNSNSS
jgi:hypothetical protein